MTATLHLRPQQITVGWPEAARTIYSRVKPPDIKA